MRSPITSNGVDVSMGDEERLFKFRWSPPTWRVYRNLPADVRKRVWKQVRPGWFHYSTLYFLVAVSLLLVGLHRDFFGSGWVDTTLVWLQRVNAFTLFALAIQHRRLGASRSLPHVLREFGYCAVCGYDMRASADRCPECGTRIDATG